MDCNKNQMSNEIKSDERTNNIPDIKSSKCQLSNPSADSKGIKRQLQSFFDDTDSRKKLKLKAHNQSNDDITRKSYGEDESYAFDRRIDCTNLHLKDKNAKLEKETVVSGQTDNKSGGRNDGEHEIYPLFADRSDHMPSACKNGTAKFTTALPAPVAIEEHWVCCDWCLKWRLLPYEMNLSLLPRKWRCSMQNWLPGMNSCDISEEETTNAVNALYIIPPEFNTLDGCHDNATSGIGTTTGPAFKGFPKLKEKGKHVEVKDKETEDQALERILIDANAEPFELSYKFLENITNHFTEEISRGGFGVVYMGVLGNKKVAVKKLFQTNDFSDKQFLDELACLRRVKHKNIVRFVGYCSDAEQKVVMYEGKYVIAENRRRFLCFEYVPNKSLHDYLKDESHGHEWDTRYQLILGICQGLRYLHNTVRITHLDLKPENILLDASMVPKITDFGTSRFFTGQKSRIVTKNIVGSSGYIAPEYWFKGEVSFKADIYSLGIIIKKILLGSNDLSDLENGHQLVNIDSLRVKKCIEIAQLCVCDDPRQRPTIDHIIDMLIEKKIVTEIT